MPRRTTPLINGQYYHIYNKSIEGKSIFEDQEDHRRFILTLAFYLYHDPTMKLARFMQLSARSQGEVFTKRVKEKRSLVSLITFLSMPDHYHLIISQTVDGGVSTYMRHVQDSYTRYYNTRHKRVGPLFLGPYKAKQIELGEHLAPLTRIIHREPLMRGVVDTTDALSSYLWSSLPEYLGIDNRHICDSRVVLHQFQDDTAKYRAYIEAETDISQSPEEIKHLLFD